MINRSINGYTFLEFLGAGSFGSVYRALRENQTFAVKIFREEFVLSEYLPSAQQNRLKREIEIMKSVSHPYLVKYVDDFLLDDLGVKYFALVMEMADGVTLKELISKQSEASEAEMVEVFRQIVVGIKALHEIRGLGDDVGIIHRDLKPENIIVGNNGVKIIDYGLSKVIDYTTLTSTGQFLGSPLYASPEQITDSKNIDRRSDLYTLGVIFYEMLTKQIPYQFQGLPDLINKIKNEPPIPPRKFRANITNRYENIILRLLEKLPFNRYSSADELLADLDSTVDDGPTKPASLKSRFVLRLLNDLTVITEFQRYVDGPMVVEFPAIHQFKQKSLLNTIQSSIFQTIVDPETVRFAYSTYTDREGLKKLPYCPEDYQVITPAYLQSHIKQQEYVKQVIDEEFKLGADIFVSPYHYAHNTTILPTYKQNPVEQWFDLDIKLLKESIDYKNSVPAYDSKLLFAGISVNAQSLINESYKNDLLNFYSAQKTDGYILLVDGIGRDTNSITLFHYLDTLTKLQRSTGRPVIAGRVNLLGLGLLSLGVAAFSSGAARFDNFSEDLHKDPSTGYNMYERYYFPELLSTVAIERKLPTKFNAISSVLTPCSCPFCRGKQKDEVINSKNTKLHFLYWIQEEIRVLLEQKEPKQYFLKRIEVALEHYKSMPQIFKKEDFKHLSVWHEVFSKVN